MKDRGPWRISAIFLLFAAGNLCIPLAVCQSYGEGGARGDEGGNSAGLGFSGVVTRHDGYVKGETPTIPQTSFSCSATPYNPGLYADVETNCQVYHVCFEDRQESFLCGPGTTFNQRILACDFWYNFDCKESPSFFNANQDIGKVPDTIFKPDQSRTQQPSYPSYPRQPDQPPSVGSYPPSISIPPPPSRITPQPQPPRFQPPSTVTHVQQPERPAYQPQPPSIQPQPPRIQPPSTVTHVQQPERPAYQPQPPSIQPQPPRIQPPSTVIHVQQPERPAYQPQTPIAQPQPPRVRPQPPAFRPPYDSSRDSIKPQYPSPPTGGRTPSIQQQEENGYQFDGYQPPKPVSLPPPQPTSPLTPRPVFPPVSSPPRISRPPLTPTIIRQPERPRVPVIVSTRPEYHPDSNIKGNNDYRPPQQGRVPQPSRPVVSEYPRYPVPQRPVSQVPVSQRPVSQVTISQKPVERPSSRPPYQPPQTVQQEHVDTEYIPPPPPPKQPSRPTTFVPPPPPPPPKQPSRPTSSYVPPPAVQQEVILTKPPQPPSRIPSPPPVAQKPIDRDYGKPQPPVAPSIISERQKPAIPPPSRPQVSVVAQPPSRPKPVFPPPSDHPNANIKGGPGYQQPPPQPPRFEPTRISRPSTPQSGYQVPPQVPRSRPSPSGGYDTTAAVKPVGEKRPVGTGSASYKPPQQGRVKKPSEPTGSIYQPPRQVIIDHPQSEIKGSGYEAPKVLQQPQRIKSPSTSVSGVKRPQTSGGYQTPQVQRPRAPVVVSRPQPPSLPSTSIKKTTPADSQAYDKPRPQPPAISRVKQPSQSQIQHIQTSSGQSRFPSHQPIDHPNANIKGGPGYNQPRPQTHPVGISQINRPSGPPSSPSTSYEQKTSSSGQRQPIGSGYPSPPSRPSYDGPSQQQIKTQQDFKPQRRPSANTITSSQKVPQASSGVKTVGYQQPSSSHQAIRPQQLKPEYDGSSSYTRGPEIYPKPEFGQPSAPYQPISTPSRSSQISKQGTPSQNTITQTQIKPAYQGSPASSGSGVLVRPDYPNRDLPGHQPPHQRQVFPHRENPDHPNESIKGSGAYRPPPPAGFQAAASETQEQKVLPEPEPASSPLLGDVGAE